jgi:hypothetical protein
VRQGWRDGAIAAPPWNAGLGNGRKIADLRFNGRSGRIYVCNSELLNY